MKIVHGVNECFGSAMCLVNVGFTVLSPMLRCKLRTRHWSILGADGKGRSTVNGAGVIGKYPDLVAGGSSFHYQSCTRQYETDGSMEGHFLFADLSASTASIDHSHDPKTGVEDDFVVQCPRFPTQIPDTIF